jgi:hypothetical protein
MAIKLPEWTELRRTHLLGLLLLLGLVVAMPVPEGDLSSRNDVSLLLIWVGTLVTAWSMWFRRDLADLFWVVALIGAFLAFLFRGTMFSLVSLVIWRVWLFYRERRVSRLGSMALALLFGVAHAQTSATTPAPVVGDNPAYLKGYKINDVTSCRQVDVVPWTLNVENRQARLLIRDSLRLSTELKYSDWSVYQTMDPEGSTTFIFERSQSDGAKEYYLTKGAVFNRIVKRGTTRTVAEMKNLTNLIDSPALEFYHRDGSRLSFLPGSSGTSKLRVYLSARPGARLLPPLFLEGRHCTRPESAFDQDDQPGRQSTAPGAPAMPSAPVAGGASSAGAGP